MSKYDAPCAVCGTMLPGTPQSLPVGRRKCHPCRKDFREARLAAQRSARAVRIPVAVSCVSCVTCGTEFASIAKSAKYCGPDCRPRPLGSRPSGMPCAEPGCTRESYTGKYGLCCTHYNRRYQPNRSHGDRRQWERDNPDLAEMRRRRRRARKKAATSEPYTLIDIAARDKYVCQLCHRRVAMSRRVPHPKAPTIDHVVPLVESLDDTRANVQLAHFACNSRKGAAGGGEQLALFG